MPTIFDPKLGAIDFDLKEEAEIKSILGDETKTSFKSNTIFDPELGEVELTPKLRGQIFEEKWRQALTEKQVKAPFDPAIPREQRIVDPLLEEKEGTLFKVFDVLQRGQFASANVASSILEGRFDLAQSAWRGLTGEEKGTYVDILKKQKVPYPHALGLALDIGLDPTTYLPFGILTKPIKAVGQPIVGAIKRSETGKAIGGLVKPGFALPQSYYEKKLLTKYALQNDELKVLEKLGQLAQDLSPIERELLSKARESPQFISTLPENLANKLQEFADEFDRLGLEAVNEGLIKQSQFDKWRGTYLPHITERSRKQMVRGELPPGMFEKVKKPTFAKKRTFNTIEELEEHAIETGQLDLLPEKDIAKILGIREIEQTRQLAKKHFVESTLEEFGQRINVKDIHAIPEGVGVYLPKGAIRFYPVKTVDRSFISQLEKNAEKLKKLASTVEETTKTTVKAEKAGEATGALKKLEEVVQQALESRGMSPNEASIFINKLKISGKGGTGEIIEEITTKTKLKDISSLSPDELIPWEKVRDAVGITKKVPAYMLPKEIADDLNKLQRFFIGDKSTNWLIRNVYDKPLSAWKSMATSLRLPFHLRNFQSNTFLMWIGGTKAQTIPKRIKQASAIQWGRKGTIRLQDGSTMTYDQIRNLAGSHGIRGRGWIGGDINEHILREMDEMLDGGGRLRKMIRHPLKQTVELSRKVGVAVEDNARIGLFVDSLIKGENPVDAARRVRKYLFDYSELTPFEQNVMKRVVPFYTWMRKNIPLQIQSVVEQPGKYATVGKTYDAVMDKFQETVQEKMLKPDYFKEMIYFKSPFKTKEGSPVYMSIDMPYNDLQRMFSLQQAISSITPAKAIAEIITNIKTFPAISKLEKVEGFTKVPAPFYVMWLPDRIKNFIGAEPIRSPITGEQVLGMRAKYVHALNTMFPVLSEMTRMFPQPIRIEEERSPWRLLSYVTGIKFAPVNQQQNRIYKALETKGKLNDVARVMLNYGRPLTDKELKAILKEDFPRGE
jgi:hypothetical protein